MREVLHKYDDHKSTSHSCINATQSELKASLSSLYQTVHNDMVLIMPMCSMKN